MTAGTTGWVHKGAALLFIVFCMELGLFLMVYPWTSRWTMNLIPTWLPFPSDVWLSGYMRGAVSGLGVANVFVAIGEVFRNRPSRAR